MGADELKILEKSVKKNKRLASEQAMELHDLIEDRLPAAYKEIMAIAQSTFDACQAWDEANNTLLKAQAQKD